MGDAAGRVGRGRCAALVEQPTRPAAGRRPRRRGFQPDAVSSTTSRPTPGKIWRNRNDAGERYRLEQVAKARLNQRYGLFGDELRQMQRANEYGSAGY